MKIWIVILALAAGPAWAQQTAEEPQPVTLVNVLADRPVFNYAVQGVVQTRALEPGERVNLSPGLFSGLGEKKVPLAGGSVYYLARFGALPRLYRLTGDQVLVYNGSGTALALTLGGAPEVSGVVGTGNLALGAVENAGGLTVTWEDPAGVSGSIDAEGGRVYRLVRGNGPGAAELIPWE